MDGKRRGVCQVQPAMLYNILTMIPHATHMVGSRRIEGRESHLGAEDGLVRPYPRHPWQPRYRCSRAFVAWPQQLLTAFKELFLRARLQLLLFSMRGKVFPTPTSVENQNGFYIFLVIRAQVE